MGFNGAAALEAAETARILIFVITDSYEPVCESLSS